MADQLVKLVADGANAGQQVDCAELTVAAETVIRQKICVADPTTPSAVAAVKDASVVPAATDPALVVTESPNSPVIPLALRDLVGTPTAVKASPGTLYGISAINSSGATAYVQVFDVATGGVTPGTTVPILEFKLDTGAQYSLPLPARGVGFSVAITVISTTAEKGGTGSAAGVQVFAQYA